VVLIPRLSYYINKGLKELYSSTAQKSIHFIYFLSFPMTAFIIALAPGIIRVLGGTQFAPAVITLRIAALVVPVIGFTNFLGQQVFMANGEEKKLFVSTLIAAPFSVVANAVLARYWARNGTAFAVLLAEIVVLLVQLRMARRDYLLFSLFDRRSIQYLTSAAVTGIALWGASTAFASLIVHFAVLFPCCLATYFGSLILVGDPLAIEILSLFSRVVPHRRR
ncbi:MAG: hypothetical protein GF331_02490, partial [Chitinivibrionales bacterium]|nr:hypothetical protein [Chitinivibrionales bacterium]